ncbi:hypothetical protein BaRGS_00006708 [Batillaria attramentaria]|uniref:Uncharacterized protein n=1 Tax=Batillaria attramentaria TaxID=370345 RepID=A0ABD0LR46_9CAEN
MSMMTKRTAIWASAASAEVNGLSGQGAKKGARHPFYFKDRGGGRGVFSQRSQNTESNVLLETNTSGAYLDQRGDGKQNSNFKSGTRLSNEVRQYDCMRHFPFYL